ncbi:maleylpyruvate isomerase N-terminal domain-containing protein [Streptomyces sp. NPDC052676]|uniref:maleylpyruvate isomerase N-terminal domain-containing protein n=1 Tax=Streptomyces sp. NPDC052676 TaxID=3154953 RepID=UPI00342F8931
MTLSWPELVRTAAEDTTAALEKGADQDWDAKAGDLDWSCRETLSHIALGVVGYAGLLIARPTDRYITLFSSIDGYAPVPAALEGIRIAGTLLAGTVRDTPPDVRAWHPYGHSDAAGFAAMGVLELVVHGRDIGQAVGVQYTPSDALAAPVVERLFPDAPTGHSPAETLLWCTGRVALPGLPRRGAWRWDGRVREA